MPDADPLISPPDQIAGVIEQRATELRGMAERAGLPMLAYLIGMVQLEAGLQTRRAGRAAAPAAPRTPA